MAQDRIADTFARLKAEGRAGLITFTMAGDPDPETSLAVLQALPAAGADIVEFGMPFSDPLADGPAVQRAGQRALARPVPLSLTLDLVRRFRAGDAATPVVLMGYYNPIYIYGPERFVADARAAGVDGLILVDLPAEMDGELTVHALGGGLSPIRLITPTTDAERLAQVLPNTRGFLYYVSIKGITGAALTDFGRVAEEVAAVRAQTDLPMAVGFGIKTPEDAAEVGRFADAVVVGSALVTALEESLDGGAATEGTVEAVAAPVRALAQALRR